MSRRPSRRLGLAAPGHCRSSRFERLEQRALLAMEPQLLGDLNAAGSSDPLFFVEAGGAVYFSAIGADGRELWKSDGTTAGTVRVKDIRAGGQSSYPSYLANLNSTLYFAANDGVNGSELWKSDGTTAGTVLVKDIRTGAASSSPYKLTNVNGTLYFAANDGVTGQELWKSDGTAAGTVLVKDIQAGIVGSNPRYPTNVNGTLFFESDDGVSGRDLWKSDGTTAGTALVRDLLDVTGFTLTNVNGTLYFKAFDGVNGGLWKSDGTTAGTVVVKDVRTGGMGSGPGPLTNVNGTLYFSADNGVNGEELWKSDGTPSGTVLVKDIQTGIVGSTPRYLANFNGTLYFRANDGVNGGELWKSDGTPAGTVLVKDIHAGGASSFPWFLTNVNGTLYFSAGDGVNGSELWTSDGTTAGTVLVKDIRSGVIGSEAAYLTNVNGALYFTADDGFVGREPWIVRTAVAGRRVFYNHSSFDGNDAGASAADDNSIDPSKSALLPGQTASFTNYTGYSRGLNGIMVDIAGPHGAIGVADFSVKVGNNNVPGSWASGPAPTSVTLRAGAGVGGSDRYTLIWADNFIRKQWAQITVLANANTGLSTPDVFYFGNALGDVGNTSANAIVSSADEALISLNQRSPFNPAPITFPYDINKDRLVSLALDGGLSRVNQTTAFTALRLIAAPTEAAGASAATDLALTSLVDKESAGVAGPQSRRRRR